MAQYAVYPQCSSLTMFPIKKTVTELKKGLLATTVTPDEFPSLNCLGQFMLPHLLSSIKYLLM